MMIKQDLILIGGGGHALTCLDIVEMNKKYTIKGYIAKSRDKRLASLRVSYLGDDDIINSMCESSVSFVLAIGQILSPDLRINLFYKIIKLGGKFPSFISDTAFVSDSVDIDIGVIVGHGALLNTHAKIEKNCIINSRALIEHGSVVKKHSHIAPGAIILGDVEIGEGSFIGAGAVIREGVKIAPRSVVGAGSIVLKDNI